MIASHYKENGQVTSACRLIVATHVSGADDKPLVEKSIAELELDDGELRVEKQRLSAMKQSLQGEAARLNAKCATRIATAEYHKIQRERSEVVRQITGIEADISGVNARRTEVLAVLEVRKRQSGMFAPTDVRRLVEMRDRWHAASMDTETHQKAREMAWKNSQELRDFLKPYFSEMGSRNE